MPDPVATTVSHCAAIDGPDSHSRTALKMRSLTPSRMRALSPTKFMKKVQRFASPGRRRMSDQGSNINHGGRTSSPSKSRPLQSEATAVTIVKSTKSTKSLTRLHRLAKHHLWDEIMGILQYETEKDITQWLQQCQTHHRSPIPGGSPLHVVLFYQPPLAVVNHLIPALVHTLDANSVPEDSIDPVRGQTPLHVAVALGCDFTVIERLTTVTATQTLDVEGRLPLHWACTARPQPNLRVLQLLVATYPAARKIADQFQFTPLMIAQYNRAPLDICHLLLPTTFLHPSTSEQLRNYICHPQNSHPQLQQQQLQTIVTKSGRLRDYLVVVEDDSTTHAPEDLPWEVTLGKSMSDISCLHMSERYLDSKKAAKSVKKTALVDTPARAKSLRRGKRPNSTTKTAASSGTKESSSSSSSKKSLHQNPALEEHYETVEL